MAANIAATDPLVSERRGLTAQEVRLARSMFGDAIDLDGVELVNRRWAFFQPRNVVMAPMGRIHFHPHGDLFCEDFCAAPTGRQGLLLHELTHVWQTQTRGRWYLPLMRHPFVRYDYVLERGKPFDAYGLEQQAEIVRHAFLLRQGIAVSGKPGLSAYEAVLPFGSGEVVSATL